MKLLTPKVKALLVVLLLVAVMFYYWSNYSHFLEQGKRPPAEAIILNKLEKDGIPDFQIKGISGQDITLSQFRGKLVVLNFWASWCDPCVAEFPSLMALLKKFNDKIVIIAISADFEEQDIHNFLKALGANHKNLHIAWDKDSAIAKKFGTFKLPESFIIGKKGEFIRKVSGVDDWASTDAFEFFEILDNKP